MTPKENNRNQKIEIDAAGQILGRLAAGLAIILREKDKVGFLHRLQPTQKVVVYNTDGIRVSGNKIETKLYRRHSDYPGGIKEETLKQVMKKDSRQALRRAVYGMLPKNKLRDRVINNLILFKNRPV